MKAPQQIKKKINQIENLGNIVTTMKNIASVNISHYERRVHFLREYFKTVEMGFQILLKSNQISIEELEKLQNNKKKKGLIVIGSEKGLCGEFNVKIRNFFLQDLGKEEDEVEMIGIGEKILEKIQGYEFEALAFPPSLGDVSGILQQLITLLHRWVQTEGVGEIFFYYNQLDSGLSFKPVKKQVFPLDLTWLKDLQTRAWNSPVIPMYRISKEALFYSLTEEYLYISLYQAFVESLASENAARLKSMEGAEQNFKDQLSELQKEYQEKRQNQITEELFDIISGFEMLKQQDSSSPP